MTSSIVAGLVHDEGRGALHYEGVRYLLIRPETLAGFHVGLEAEVGAQRAGEILYQGGFEGGRRSGQNYRQRFGLDDEQAVAFMCRMGGEIGWGRFRLVELATADSPRLTVEVDGSPFAEAYRGAASRGVCHTTRGVLGGLMAGLLETDVIAEEPACLACGDPYCRFEVRSA